MEKTDISGITYSCYHQVSRQGENFVPQHTLSYQLAGSFVLADGSEVSRAEAGSLHLVRRNQLVKFIKYPPANGDFESLNIFLSEETLRKFAHEYHITSAHHSFTSPLVAIEMDAVLTNFIKSLQTMIDKGYAAVQPLMEVKYKELLLILLQCQPDLKDILFDFTEPHKIDLEAFMNQNFRFNVTLERFAYLSGRSLTTFKRDFARIFNASPHKWILQKRLSEAHYLIREKGKTASEIYLDVGFEDLSHFSNTFKREFGYSPRMVTN